MFKVERKAHQEVPRNCIWDFFLYTLKEITLFKESAAVIDKDNILHAMKINIKVDICDELVDIVPHVEQNPRAFFPDAYDVAQVLDNVVGMEKFEYGTGKYQDNLGFCLVLKATNGYVISRKVFSNLRKKFLCNFKKNAGFVLNITQEQKKETFPNVFSLKGALSVPTHMNIFYRCRTAAQEVNRMLYQKDKEPMILEIELHPKQEFAVQFEKAFELVTKYVYCDSLTSFQNPLKQSFQVNNDATHLKLGTPFILNVSTGLEDMQEQVLRLCRTQLFQKTQLVVAVMNDAKTILRKCEHVNKQNLEEGPFNMCINVSHYIHKIGNDMEQALKTKNKMSGVRYTNAVLNQHMCLYANDLSMQDETNHDSPIWSPLLVGPKYTVCCIQTMGIMGQLILRNQVKNSQRQVNTLLWGESNSGKSTMLAMLKEHFNGQTGNITGASQFSAADMKDASILVDEEIPDASQLTVGAINKMKASFDIQQSKRVEQKYKDPSYGLQYVPWIITSNSDFLLSFRMDQDQKKKDAAAAMESRFVKVHWDSGVEMDVYQRSALTRTSNEEQYGHLARLTMIFGMFKYDSAITYYTTPSIIEKQLTWLIQLLRDPFNLRMFKNEKVMAFLFTGKNDKDEIIEMIAGLVQDEADAQLKKVLSYLDATTRIDLENDKVAMNRNGDRVRNEKQGLDLYRVFTNIKAKETSFCVDISEVFKHVQYMIERYMVAVHMKPLYLKALVCLTTSMMTDGNETM